VAEQPRSPQWSHLCEATVDLPGPATSTERSTAGTYPRSFPGTAGPSVDRGLTSAFNDIAALRQRRSVILLVAGGRCGHRLRELVTGGAPVTGVVGGGNVPLRLACSSAFALVVFALGGCSVEFSVGSGEEMPKGELERSIADSLEREVGQRPDAVECPSGVTAEVGESLRCVLTAGQDRLGLTATVTAVDGDDVGVDIQVDDVPMA
jgi:hypothetical protein